MRKKGDIMKKKKVENVSPEPITLTLEQLREGAERMVREGANVTVPKGVAGWSWYGTKYYRVMKRAEATLGRYK